MVNLGWSDHTVVVRFLSQRNHRHKRTYTRRNIKSEMRREEGRSREREREREGGTSVWR